MLKQIVKGMEAPKVEMRVFLGMKNKRRKQRFAYVDWNLDFKYRLLILKLFALIWHTLS